MWFMKLEKEWSKMWNETMREILFRCGKDYEIECDNYDYCPRCGQAIDKIWEEENE